MHGVLGPQVLISIFSGLSCDPMQVVVNIAEENEENTSRGEKWNTKVGEIIFLLCELLGGIG